MAKKRSKRKAPRKNPKRVAAGRKAAAARWSKKSSKKSKKRIDLVSKVDRAIEKVLARKYAISVDGSVHKVSFPGSHTKKGKGRKRKVSAETLAHLARGRAIRKANLAAKQGIPGGKMDLYQKRIANLAKARAVRASKKMAKGAATTGMTWASWRPSF